MPGRRPVPEESIWHDAECGTYRADLELWRALAAEFGDPILDVGSGTGRVALDLARAGHEVTALDVDARLAEVLRSRAAGLGIDVVVGDARSLALGRRFPLIVVPMQTIQLLLRASDRLRFFRRAIRHLAPGGRLALAISPELETFDVADGLTSVAPDVLEHDNVVYASQPTAVKPIDGGYVLERRRERIFPDGRRSTAHDTVRLAELSVSQLEAEAAQVGLEPAGRRVIPPTSDHVGSVVVMLSA